MPPDDELYQLVAQCLEQMGYEHIADGSQFAVYEHAEPPYRDVAVPTSSWVNLDEMLRSLIRQRVDWREFMREFSAVVEDRVAEIDREIADIDQKIATLGQQADDD